MAHGQPDYAGTTSKVTTFGLSDMAELAARLGSIVTFDRRGDVIFADGFESGLVCFRAFGFGTGASASQSALYARSGGFSCKLVAGSGASHYAVASKYIPLVVTGTVGFEVSFTLSANTGYISLNISSYDGTNYTRGVLKYDPTADTLSYYDDTGAWQVLESSLDLVEQDYIFHTIKLVIDLDAGTYKRAILNENSYDLSSYDLRSTANTTTPQIVCSLYQYSDLGTNPAIYIDDFIITQNEP